MAQRVSITVESDLSGNADASTLEFGLDGQAYEVDLTDAEQEKFRAALAKYVGVARTVGKGKGKGKRAAAVSDGPSAKVVREWAQANGHEVPDRGRIPAEIREAYVAAN